MKYSNQAVLAPFSQDPAPSFRGSTAHLLRWRDRLPGALPKVESEGPTEAVLSTGEGLGDLWSASHRIVLLLIVHLLLGFRRLRDVDYYRDDPLVRRLLGLHRLPDVATLCRTLAAMGGIVSKRCASCLRR